MIIKRALFTFIWALASMILFSILIWATRAKLSGIKRMQELRDIITVIEANYSAPRNKAAITISSRDKIPRYIKKMLLVN